MNQFVAITSFITGCLAIFLIFFPTLRWPTSSPQVSGTTEYQQPPPAQSQNYSTVSVSTDPLLIYIINFLSSFEIDHILNVTEGSFVPSQVYSPGSSSHRNSSSCVLPSSDPIHDLIIARSREFLDKVLREYPATGLSYFDIEPLQLVRYGPSEYYHAHVDWFDTLHRENKGWNSRLYNRGASFFLYLKDDCVGGGTHFPHIAIVIKKTHSGALQHLMTSAEGGISFEPRKGNGLFWVNLQPGGMGDDRLLHAGLPVKQGTKIGMNIWVKRDFGW